MEKSIIGHAQCVRFVWRLRLVWRLSRDCKYHFRWKYSAHARCSHYLPQWRLQRENVLMVVKSKPMGVLDRPLKREDLKPPIQSTSLKWLTLKVMVKGYATTHRAHEFRAWSASLALTHSVSLSSRRLTGSLKGHSSTSTWGTLVASEEMVHHWSWPSAQCQPPYLIARVKTYLIN